MKLKTNFIFSAILVIILFSCDSTPDPEPMSSEKLIKSFKIENREGIIDETNKTVSINLPMNTNPSMLIPTISVSDKAMVSPASGEPQDFSNPVTYTVTAEDASTNEYIVTVELTCAKAEDVHNFTIDGKSYEVIKMTSSWIDAMSCALERGGYLAEINDANENSGIFNELLNNSNLDLSKTTSVDGGMASYVWIGANDSQTEGEWIWDGDNDGVGISFWTGDVSGTPVNGAFENWGNEPDNFEDQDFLGLALTEWPLGTGTLGNAGQWNDLSTNNSLYFLIEFD